MKLFFKDFDQFSKQLVFFVVVVVVAVVAVVVVAVVFVIVVVVIFTFVEILIFFLFSTFSFFFVSLKRHYIGFSENYYLFLYAVYQCEHAFGKLRWRLPNFIKNYIFEGGASPSQKNEENHTRILLITTKCELPYWLFIVFYP